MRLLVAAAVLVTSLLSGGIGWTLAYGRGQSQLEQVRRTLAATETEAWELRQRLRDAQGELERVRGVPYAGVHPCIRAYPEAERFAEMVVAQVREVVGRQWAFQACVLFHNRAVFELVAPDGRYQLIWAWNGDWWAWEGAKRLYPQDDALDGGS